MRAAVTAGYILYAERRVTRGHAGIDKPARRCHLGEAAIEHIDLGVVEVRGVQKLVTNAVFRDGQAFVNRADASAVVNRHGMGHIYRR